MSYGINVKAITIGFFISMVAGVSGLCLLETLLAIHSGGLGSWVHGKYEANDLFLNLTKSTPVRLAAVAIVGIGSLIGGVATGWLASSHRLKNALILAVIRIALCAPAMSSPEHYPIWLTILETVVTLTFTVLGGWIAEVVVRLK